MMGSEPEVPAVKLPFRVIYQKRESNNENSGNDTFSQPSSECEGEESELLENESSSMDDDEDDASEPLKSEGVASESQ